MLDTGKEVFERIDNVDSEKDPSFVIPKALYSEADEKRVLRRIDFILLPQLAFTYGLQFLDKQALSKAAVIGLVQDTKLVGPDFALLTTIFYVGMIVAEVPVNLGLQKLPTGRFAAVLVVLWGLSLACMAGSWSFPALAACRYFLGSFEAVIGPALMLVTSSWYRRREHPTRVCIWYSAQGFAISIGGLLAAGVQKWGGSLRAWQYLFLFTGCLTIAWGFVLYFFLPDSIDAARWLTDEDKAIAKQRVQNERTTSASKTWRWQQCWECFTDPKFLLITAFAFLANWITSMNAFAGLIIKGLGFSAFQTVLLNIPSGILNVTFILSFAYINSKVRNVRWLCMVFSYTVGTVGSLMLLFVPISNNWARLGAVWLTACAPSGFTVSLSLATSNFAGSTKKTMTNAAVFLGFAFGNLISPQLYLDSQAPTYRTGVYGVLIANIGAVVVAILLALYMKRENSRRNSLALSDPAADPAVPLASDFDPDCTEVQNKKFRFML